MSKSTFVLQYSPFLPRLLPGLLLSLALPSPSVKASDDSDACKEIVQAFDALNDMQFDTGAPRQYAEVFDRRDRAFENIRRLDRETLASLIPVLVQRHCEHNLDNISYRRALELIEEKQIDLLSSQLASLSEDCQIQLLLILADLSRSVEPVVDDVAAMLRSENKYVWHTAANVLSGIGDPALPAVMRILNDDDPEGYRAEAVMIALAEFDELDAETIRQVVGFLTHSNATVRREASHVLAKRKNLSAETLDTLGKALVTEDFEINAAVIAITMTRAGASGCDALKKVVTTAPVEARAGAVFGLVECPDEYMPSLLKFLDDPHDKVRVRTIEALDGESLWFGPPDNPILGSARKPGDKLSPEIAVQLGRMLSTSGVDAKIAAAYALGKGKPLPEGVIRSLGSALTNDDAYLRWSAAVALSETPNLDERTIEALTHRLSDKSEFVQGAAAMALAQHPRHQAVIPALVTLLQRTASSDRPNSHELRLFATDLFRRRTPQCFFFHDWSDRWPLSVYERPAEVALVRVGIDSIPALVAVLETEPEQDVETAVSRTILAMGPPAIAKLRECLHETTAPTEVELQRLIAVLQSRPD